MWCLILLTPALQEAEDEAVSSVKSLEGRGILCSLMLHFCESPRESTVESGEEFCQEKFLLFKREDPSLIPRTQV